MFLFWFWTKEVDLSTEQVINVESVSEELVSSWSWDVLLFSVLAVSIVFAYFSKNFA